MSACAPRVLPTVEAVVETAPVASGDDAADDPAIWVNDLNPHASLIVATDKRRGLETYDLNGSRIQDLPIGNVNNIDVRQDVAWQDQRIDIGAGTNRSTQSLTLFLLDRETRRIEVLAEVPLAMETPYGVCLHRADGGSAVHAFVNDKSGLYQQWELKPDGESRMVMSFTVESQPEGCVVDDVQERLYFGVEEVGVFAIDIEAIGVAEPEVIDLVSGGRLVADVEGLALYHEDGNATHLIVSSQGDNSFAVYRLGSNPEYAGSFRIAERSDQSIDGVSETDGIEVHAGSLGTGFPRGVVVVQDGENTSPSENQNFKLVDWREIESELGL